MWIGNLNEISLLRGYWIKSANASTISVLANELPGHTDLIYYLHSGANLISFPFDGAYPLTDVLPPELVNITTSIIGEGEATSNGVNGWIGSLTTLQGGRGYWFKLTDDIDFQFVVPGARSGVNNTRNRN